MNLYKSIFEALERAGIEYLIVGGVAVNLYGYNRFTGDIDILMALTPKNLEKMDELMRKLGYIKKEGLEVYAFIAPEMPQLDINIPIKETMDFSQYNKRKTTIEVWDMRLPVMNINDLLSMERPTERRIDLEKLKRGKHSSTESKLEWLSAALYFAKAEKRIVKQNKEIRH